MRNITEHIKRFLLAEDGPTAVEYAVMLALIFLVCIAAVQAIGVNTSAIFQDAADGLT